MSTQSLPDIDHDLTFTEYKKECLLTKEGNKVSARDLLSSYTKWLINKQLNSDISVVKFATVCESCNLKSKRIASGKVYLDIDFVPLNTKVYDTPKSLSNGFMAMVAYDVDDIKTESPSYKESRYISNYNSYELKKIDNTIYGARIYKNDADLIKCKSLIIYNQEYKVIPNDIIIYYENYSLEWTLPAKVMNIVHKDNKIIIDLSDLPLLLPCRYDEVINFTIELLSGSESEININAELFIEQICLDIYEHNQLKKSDNIIYNGFMYRILFLQYRHI